MLSVDKDGWITDKNIAKEQRSAIEHSAMGEVNAIVLHRTASTNAASVVSAWKTKKEGTHILVSEDGKIYQTASLKKQCWHVGKIYARCSTVSSCSTEDAKSMDKILRRKNVNWGIKFQQITERELGKNYPERFPHNHDSLGIEIVGVLSAKTEIYEIPNKTQLDSLFWLLDELVASYKLTISDVYAHGEIAQQGPEQVRGRGIVESLQIEKVRIAA